MTRVNNGFRTFVVNLLAKLGSPLKFEHFSNEMLNCFAVIQSRGPPNKILQSPVHRGGF